MPKLRLISNGKTAGTKIVDIDTGETVKHVKSFKYEWSHRQFAKLTVEVITGEYPEMADQSGVTAADLETPNSSTVVVCEESHAHVNRRGF